MLSCDVLCGLVMRCLLFVLFYLVWTTSCTFATDGGDKDDGLLLSVLLLVLYYLGLVPALTFYLSCAVLVWPVLFFLGRLFVPSYHVLVFVFCRLGVSLPCHCPGIVLSLSCRCLGIVLALSWHYLVDVLYYLAIVLPLPCHCLVIVSSWPCLVAVFIVLSLF